MKARSDDELRFAGLGTIFPLSYLAYQRRSTSRPTSDTPRIAVISMLELLFQSSLNTTNVNS
jgi:hypothetical protein